MRLPVLPHELGCAGEANVKVRIDLSGVPETLLISLYCRAVESQRPDALVKDERAAEWAGYAVRPSRRAQPDGAVV